MNDIESVKIRPRSLEKTLSFLNKPNLMLVAFVGGNLAQLDNFFFVEEQVVRFGDVVENLDFLEVVGRAALNARN